MTHLDQDVPRWSRCFFTLQDGPPWFVMLSMATAERNLEGMVQ